MNSTQVPALRTHSVAVILCRYRWQTLIDENVHFLVILMLMLNMMLMMLMLMLHNDGDGHDDHACRVHFAVDANVAK